MRGRLPGFRAFSALSHSSCFAVSLLWRFISHGMWSAPHGRDSRAPTRRSALRSGYRNQSGFSAWCGFAICLALITLRSFIAILQGDRATVGELADSLSLDQEIAETRAALGDHGQSADIRPP